MKKVIALYSECSATARHYSSILMKMRTTTIIQGIVLLYAALVQFQNCEFAIAIIITLFGICASIVFNLLTHNYIQNFEIIKNSLTQLEEKICEEEINDSKKKVDVKPWTEYSIVRDNRFEKGYGILLNYGPIIVIYIGFYIILVLSIISILFRLFD